MKTNKLVNSSNGIVMVVGKSNLTLFEDYVFGTYYEGASAVPMPSSPAKEKTLYIFRDIQGGIQYQRCFIVYRLYRKGALVRIELKRALASEVCLHEANHGE